MNDEKNDKETVGYGKPPIRSQFKRGQSGNPKGRPRGSKNFVKLLQQALDEQVIVTENGHRRRITKREAMAKQLANRAASGDPRTAKFLYELDAKTGRLGEPVERKEVQIPNDLQYWANVIVALYEAGALRNAPPGLKDAIETADWDLLKQVAGLSPELEADEEVQKR